MDKPFYKQWLAAMAMGSLFLLFSCATLPKHPLPGKLTAYEIDNDKTLLERLAPVFVIESPNHDYNLIGTPGAAITDLSKETVFVDPGKATVYTREKKFKTSKGSYTNLVYRVHFSEIPSGFDPFHIGQGKNVGLIVIITLNTDNEPLLYTTVHTCGCYLAFIPTSFMPENRFPDHWTKEPQSVYSEELPGFLDYTALPGFAARALIFLRDGSHRVKKMELNTADSLKKFDRVDAATRPLAALEALSMTDGRTTSFYETSGYRKDYVKESHKPWERILMSWWAFDWRIGEDKKFGIDKSDGIMFYTSLKPWGKKKSDMRDFSAFLRYWGWNL